MNFKMVLVICLVAAMLDPGFGLVFAGGSGCTAYAGLGFIIQGFSTILCWKECLEKQGCWSSNPVCNMDDGTCKCNDCQGRK